MNCILRFVPTIKAVAVLDYEPNNKTAKDFYPQLLSKVNEQNSSSSDENCNHTSSLEFVDNEILDNDMDNVSVSSSISSTSISSNDDHEDSESNSDEADQRDREDLIRSLSHSSSQSSNSSDQLPKSMSSSSSQKENTSNSFSFTSLLLDESEDVNNNESTTTTAAPAQEHQNPSSPFTTKIMQMFKRKWDGESPSKQN